MPLSLIWETKAFFIMHVIASQYLHWRGNPHVEEIPMIHLRPFRPCDWQVITQYQYTNLSQADAIKMIGEFNTPTYQGKFHKLLAVTNDAQVVGYVSMIETVEGTVSIGVEVYVPFRRQGYAFSAISQLLTIANACGYHTATAQVRKDNTPSLALHKKLGFSVVDETISRRGNPVYNLVKSI